MKKEILRFVGCIAVAIALAGCAHSRDTSAEEKKPLAINIARDGTFSIAGQKYDKEELATQLAANRPEAVIIRSHADVPFAQLRAVMEACKTAGVQQVNVGPPK